MFQSLHQMPPLTLWIVGAIEIQPQFVLRHRLPWHDKDDHERMMHDGDKRSRSALLWGNAVEARAQELSVLVARRRSVLAMQVTERQRPLPFDRQDGGSRYRALFAQQADRQQRDPTPATNDADPCNESDGTSVHQLEREDEDEISGDDEQTGGNRIPGPAARGRIGGLASCQYETRSSQRDELKLTKEIMKGSGNG